MFEWKLQTYILVYGGKTKAKFSSFFGVGGNYLHRFIYKENNRKYQVDKATVTIFAIT